MVRMKGLVGREMVSIRRGEWVNLVGWLEDGKDAVRKVGGSLYFYFYFLSKRWIGSEERVKS